LRFVRLNIECAAECYDRVVIIILPSQAIEDVDGCVEIAVGDVTVTM
jgi:hypothetical protein